MRKSSYYNGSFLTILSLKLGRTEQICIDNLTQCPTQSTPSSTSCHSSHSPVRQSESPSWWILPVLEKFPFPGLKIYLFLLCAFSRVLAYQFSNGICRSGNVDLWVECWPPMDEALCSVLSTDCINLAWCTHL